jgi:hypothetical protein
MTLISYRGRAAAMAGRDRFYLAPHIAERADGDPVKTFVCYLALYARDVLCGQLPGEPGRYFPARAERYARACLIPARAFLARADRPDAELAEHFNVPLEQIAARRAELAPTHPPRAHVRAPRRLTARARRISSSRP